MANKKKEIVFIVVGLFVVAIEAVLILCVILYNQNAPQPVLATQPPTTVATQPTETEPPPTEPPYPVSGLTAEDFVMVDGFMTCTAADYMVGIDVSSHQGQIDWARVKAAGVEFVIIRLGYRGYGEEGKLVKDPMAQSYYEGAKAQGLLIGGYVFSQAICEEEAIEEAQMALEVTADWEVDLPIAFDWEFLHFEARTDDTPVALISDCANAFCKTLLDGGRQPMLYTGLYVKTLRLEEVLDYPMWLALYSEKMSYPYWLDFWQYSCTGRVDGIDTDVDLNIYLPK